ncbi:hypothetical protein AVEN_160704-1 [Araneus ventricosus]|uniref:Uncharacterized protein n=1 Tax=Araneus ventricosus TaxID=182803 RepID=A0A4Y2TX21_ARAVE|nr:hypothetical protein AVEN_160704-1 [Araneus ventricosus]
MRSITRKRTDLDQWSANRGSLATLVKLDNKSISTKVGEPKVASVPKVAHPSKVELISFLITPWCDCIVNHVSAVHVAEFEEITLIGLHGMQ